MDIRSIWVQIRTWYGVEGMDASMKGAREGLAAKVDDLVKRAAGDEPPSPNGSCSRWMAEEALRR